MLSRGTPALAMVSSIACAYSAASSIETAAASSMVSPPASDNVRIRSRSSGGYATVPKARVRGLLALKSTKAASAPSRLVPDMRPTKRLDTLLEAGRGRRSDAGDGLARLRRHALEIGLQSGGNGLGLRQGDLHRVLVHAADLEFVVEVGTRRVAGGADETDRIALPHACAGADSTREPGEVGIERRDAAAVPDLDGIPITATIARGDDGTIGGRDDPRSVRRREIHARMRPPILEDGMEAPAEARAHSRELDG